MFCLRISLALCAFLFVSCHSLRKVGTPKLTSESYQAIDGTQFPIKTWHPKPQPKTVIIGVHGISGAANDFENLGNHLIATNSDQSLIAYNLRGQGLDPISKRRGDIYSSKHWFQDLYTFTDLVRAKHPDSKIIWMGESMGSLIVMNAYLNSRKDKPCDAIILSSPIVREDYQLPGWKLALLRTCATFTPRVKLSLETLSGQKNAMVTSTTKHTEQAATNPWHIRRFTLRLLSTLDRLISRMPRCAEKVDIPLLILHGGKDVFSPAADVKKYSKRIPSATTKYYPNSFHLLFYDNQKDQVIKDTANWINSL